MELPPEPKVLEGFVNFVDLDAWYDDRDPSDEYWFNHDQEAQEEFYSNLRTAQVESQFKFAALLWSLPPISQELAMDAIGSI